MYVPFQLFRTAEKSTVQPSLGPLALAVCQRSLQCARLVTTLCGSDITGKQEKSQEVRFRGAMDTFILCACVNCLGIVLPRLVP